MVERLFRNKTLLKLIKFWVRYIVIFVSLILHFELILCFTFFLCYYPWIAVGCFALHHCYRYRTAWLQFYFYWLNHKTNLINYTCIKRLVERICWLNMQFNCRPWIDRSIDRLMWPLCNILSQYKYVAYVRYSFIIINERIRTFFKSIYRLLVRKLNLIEN